MVAFPEFVWARFLSGYGVRVAGGVGSMIFFEQVCRGCSWGVNGVPLIS